MDSKEGNGQHEEYFEGGDGQDSERQAQRERQAIKDQTDIARSQTENALQKPASALASVAETEHTREAHNIALGKSKKVYDSIDYGKINMNIPERTAEGSMGTDGQPRAVLENEKDIDLDQVLEELNLAPDQTSHQNNVVEK